MLISLLAAAASVVSVSPPVTINVDGTRVTYKVEHRSDGTRRLSGRDEHSQPFEFIAGPDGKVRGFVGNQAVTFRVAVES